MVFSADYFINHGVVFNSKSATEKPKEKQEEVVKPTPVISEEKPVERTVEEETSSTEKKGKGKKVSE